MSLIKRRLSVIVLSLATVASAPATELSANLNADQIGENVSVLVFGSLHRSWTAHSRPNEGLGLDMGVESTLVFRKDILDMGDGHGVAPRVIPVPRIWVSWDLPENFRMSGSFAPGALFDGIQSAGLGVQYTYYENKDIDASFSGLLDYTYSNVFDDIFAHSFGLSAQASKDLLVWQPYAGAGFVFSRAEVASRIPATGVGVGPRSYFVPRFYFGARIDFIAKLALQMDLTAFKPSLALLLSYSF